MKNIVILIFFISTIGYAQKVLDVVYLNNGSIIKGTIVKIVPNKDVKLTTDNGSIFIFKMSDIKEILKETQKEETKNIEITEEVNDTNNMRSNFSDNDANFSNDDVESFDDNTTTIEVADTKPKKKKKGKFWKSLGNFAAKVLDEAAKNAENNANNNSVDNNSADNNVDNNSSYNDTYQDNNNTTEDTGIVDVSVGTVCFENPNYYSRKVTLTKRNSTETQQMIIGGSDKSCNYDIPVGVYSCKVYTTYTRKLIESFNLRITEDNEVFRKLNRNYYN